MSMQFTAAKRATSNVSANDVQVFRIEELTPSFSPPGEWDPYADPIANPAYRPEFDIDLCNANAAAVAAELGWRIVDGCLDVPINKALADCTTYLQRQIGRRSPALRARIIAENPRFIDCGREEGYIESQVRRIALMLREAEARGATHLTAG
jgi:hypothetical protein